MSRALLESITRVVGNNPGVVVGNETAVQPRGENIFLGIGLLSKGNLSEGLGLGVLPMLCLATQLQMNSEPSVQRRTHILVADLHATENGGDAIFIEVTDVADAVTFQLSVIMKQLGCRTEAFRASHHQLFNFQSEKGGYSDRQTQDVLIAHRDLDCGVKVGWQSKRQNVRDEKYFDFLALNAHPKELAGLSFLRTAEGLSRQIRKCENLFNPPYFGEAGLVLGQPINIRSLASESHQMRNNLTMIGRALVNTLKIAGKPLTILQEFVDGLL